MQALKVCPSWRRDVLLWPKPHNFITPPHSRNPSFILFFPLSDGGVLDESATSLPRAPSERITAHPPACFSYLSFLLYLVIHALPLRETDRDGRGATDSSPRWPWIVAANFGTVKISDLRDASPAFRSYAGNPGIAGDEKNGAGNVE